MTPESLLRLSPIEKQIPREPQKGILGTPQGASTDALFIYKDDDSRHFDTTSTFIAVNDIAKKL